MATLPSIFVSAEFTSIVPLTAKLMMSGVAGLVLWSALASWIAWRRVRAPAGGLASASEVTVNVLRTTRPSRASRLGRRRMRLRSRSRLPRVSCDRLRKNIGLLLGRVGRIRGTSPPEGRRGLVESKSNRSPRGESERRLPPRRAGGVEGLDGELPVRQPSPYQ